MVPVLFIVFGVIVFLINTQPSPEASRLEKEEIDRFCPLKLACSDFYSTRQACAVAGDFNNCMIIKMGMQEYDMVGYCDEEGNVRFTPQNAPSMLSCLSWRVSKKLNSP
jgi:hypothetical protein